ncbi:transcription antitermination factor NusB [Flavihumibacter sp. RY-1]|uniref:Transcription antitermination protein NusB n=1 Tax=Flavihumibacter fluminis TaxID=2909236 RepID=A0ABS9BGF0_9BACT|nr:transcription antitermination factor NusB [Flavihumibacter fluminis]MCF1714777.1 transcription antitermination factor NusB [Flavihumibacter fluminis]
MISRRIIRVKVMQTLYALDSFTQPSKPGEPVRLLQKQFDQTRQLLTYILHFITEVARYAETDARNRASKHLPSAADLEVNTRIAGNQLLWKILEDTSLKAALEDDKVERFLDKELVRKIYLELVNTPEYQQYINAESREYKQEKAILEFIYTNLLIGKEVFTSHLEEIFNNWDDDCEMVHQLVQQYLSKPGSFNFQLMVSAEKMDFAKSLLNAVLDKRDITLEMIKPKLKNWDPERIATLDMILMQMGVCELLYFETIPPKVTINEYIDLAKEYSTPQSGQFVNGILDNIHKDLVRDNKLHKVSFKK